MAESCYWCHELLPPLPEDASYVEEINHYIHDDCKPATRRIAGHQTILPNSRFATSKLLTPRWQMESVGASLQAVR